MVGVQEADVVVIGSGFGGAVATLRFTEAGERVVVLERGARVTREGFQFDLDALWKPHRGSYGCNDLRGRGKHIVPWLGAAVGGGSHVYAATLKRREAWDGFPRGFSAAELAPHYDKAEAMLGGELYPDYPPYSNARATNLMYEAGKQIQKAEPALVESWGPVRLGITFAARDGSTKPGDEVINQHGCKQRCHDPAEQAILGGDIECKNTLDRNYLFLAERAGAEIRELCEADRIERCEDGRWRVTYRRHLPTSGWARFRRRWLTLRPVPVLSEPESIVARRVVVAAGAVGSTELLLRNKHVHETLPGLGAALGSRYTTNGDYLSLIVPFRYLFAVWAAFLAMLVCLYLRQWVGAGVAGGLYYLGLVASGRPYDPDIGTTNSDHIRFRGPGGESQYAYIESGRYPTPGRAVIAIAITALTGRFRPAAYRVLIAITGALRFVVPPFGALARTYPIPLLCMGRDRAVGALRLGADQRATIDYDFAPNRDFYRYLDELGRRVARAVRAYWLPNPTYVWLKKQEVPHNLGGVPMGDDPATAVVDHAGRVYGERDLMVLDGSIIPVSIGPNPALTITAIAERAMVVALAQAAGGSPIEARSEIVATEVA